MPKYPSQDKWPQYWELSRAVFEGGPYIDRHPRFINMRLSGIYTSRRGNFDIERLRLPGFGDDRDELRRVLRDVVRETHNVARKFIGTQQPSLDIYFGEGGNKDYFTDTKQLGLDPNKFTPVLEHGCLFSHVSCTRIDPDAISRIIYDAVFYGSKNPNNTHLVYSKWMQ